MKTTKATKNMRKRFFRSTRRKLEGMFGVNRLSTGEFVPEKEFLVVPPK